MAFPTATDKHYTNCVVGHLEDLQCLKINDRIDGVLLGRGLDEGAG